MGGMLTFSFHWNCCGGERLVWRSGGFAVRSTGPLIQDSARGRANYSS